MLNERMKVLQIPPRIAKRPVSPEGYPVPFFVQWIKDNEACRDGEGVPDFRIMNPQRLLLCVRNKLCWICGEKLGRHMAFVIGPMCTINRISSEPPSHLDCAMFAVRACPFLTQPRMRRNEKNMPEQTKSPAGVMIARNPGCSAIWVTENYRTIRHNEGLLFQIGDPERVLWFVEGEEATREQVMASIESGYPQLLDMAKQEGEEAIIELENKRGRAMEYVP